MTDVRVVTAADAGARDRATIAAGVPSRALMQRAGAAAAGEIARRYGDRLAHGVEIHGGPGNNGGDAWVVATALARQGIAVRCTVHGATEPRTDDARFEWERAVRAGTVGAPSGAERVVVDGLLGTGARGAPTGALAEGVARIAARRAGGATIVALDAPTGVDATSGETHGDRTVVADLTLTFGTLKRGLAVAREQAGTVVVLDIGLDDTVDDDAPQLVDARHVDRVVHRIPASAHKGTRGKIAILGGAPGMAGAPLLAAEAALRSGAGMTRPFVAPESVPVAQTALPESLASAWPAADDERLEAVTEWADVVLIGPGLGRDERARTLCERLLRTWRGPVVLDADAVTMFADRVEQLAELLAGRPALLTPHPLEFSRIAGMSLDDVLANRFDVGRDLARRLGATVLLKGVPTVVSDAHGRLVSASGTPALAVAGSGDVLGGIAAALMAHIADDASALDVAAAAAWIHGRAGELATRRRGGVRGTTLRDVLDALPAAWYERDPLPPYPALAELTAVPAVNDAPPWTSQHRLGAGAEFDVVRRLVSRWGPLAAGIGDDAAVLDLAPGERLVVSTDASVDGVHFRRDWLTPREIGYRAGASALSDLAAMGARAIGVVLALVVPESWRADLDALGEGIGDAVGLAGGRIVGGDLSSGTELSLSVTVLGAATRPVGRHGARAGDTLYVTGTLGGPLRALRALERGEEPLLADGARFAHPVARIAEGEWLAAHGATAMIDISDGLGADLRHVAAASGVRLFVEVERVPVVTGSTVIDALASGEEYELALTAPSDLDVATFAATFGVPLTRIGVVAAASEDDGPGVSLSSRVDLPPGHDHFSR